MKKSFMVVVAAAFVAILAGCSSIPDNPNLSGKWNYKYGKQQKTGSMDLVQSAQQLSGTSNDAEGQFIVSGTVKGPVVALNGKCPKSKKTYTINARMKDENTFKGTYTTTTGNFGNIIGTRQ